MQNEANAMTAAVPDRSPVPVEQSALLSPHWTSPSQVCLKRLLDLVLSTLLLLLLAPALAVIAIGIKLDSRGPFLYRWRVVGRNGKPFGSWKFRSMCVDADARKSLLLNRNEMQGPVFKLENDPRVTRFGKFLRRYSLDELPQLFSVLLGDMSLVGPRPPLVTEYEQFTDFQKQKLAVKSGMTCLWQVSGRNEVKDFDEWVNLDLEYIRRWTPLLDFWILWKTAGAIFAGTGK
jgi:lipopolysaccharide/colanic/teichoic acid biosynthesis glycosyltransferase